MSVGPRFCLLYGGPFEGNLLCSASFLTPWLWRFDWAALVCSTLAGP